MMVCLCRVHGDHPWFGGNLIPPERCTVCQLEEENKRLKERLDHALAALRHIARTCIEDPDTAQFASRASDDPPSAFAPAEDVDVG